jgi:hypothetical protein
MKNVSAALSAFLKYGPYALAAAKTAEDTIGAGNGETKKQLALGAVLAAVHAGETVPVTTVQVVSGAIDLVVSLLNSAGVFGQAKQDTPVAVPAIAAAAATN